MIYTSYFANWRKFPEDFINVSIALYPPRQFVIEARELMPTKELLDAYKNDLINEIQYEKIYNILLSKLDVTEIAEKYKNSILLCFEKSSDFCHRHLVRKWFNQNSIECVEL